MRAIKGYAASAHHILPAKLEQMCCLWDPMQMIKHHISSKRCQRRLSSLLFIHHFVVPVHTDNNVFVRRQEMISEIPLIRPSLRATTGYWTPRLSRSSRRWLAQISLDQQSILHWGGWVGGVCSQASCSNTQPYFPTEIFVLDITHHTRSQSGEIHMLCEQKKF